MKTKIDQSHIDDFIASFKKFISALKNEGVETQNAFKLLYSHVLSKKKMSNTEKDLVGNQMRNVLKTIGLTAIAIMPGGVIVAILIKALKLQKHILPSSFEYMNKN
jgi:hypothetical protein